MNQMQGGGSKVMSFGKSRAKRMSPDSPKVTFKDVAGADEAVEELHEIKEFLENPKKFQALGARIPKGVLLYGPPGTGKTLLARAVAGEAGVPFFSISGSDFVEMFVGVGASRVRDLFEQAKQASPCIIFMDEIDAVGRHRGAGLGGGHDEREQTLNQLLVEMDGFEMKDNIILIAATNRPDILDPALLRPGRFDRQIVVDRPDRLGRRKILEVHSRGKPLAREIDLDTLAAGTPGFTGADLSNLINEAALLAARNGKKMIEQDELEEGIMRVIAGPEKKARLLSEKERKITAYHEMGHALVGHYLENTNPVHKITIVSRGQALGLTISLPTEDKLPDDEVGAHGRARDDARRARRRGARLPRGHDRRRERPRARDRDLEADGHALRDEREARPARPRPQPRSALPRPRHGLRARLLGRGREGDRRRDPARDRGGARVGDRRPARAHGRAAPPLRDPDRARDDRQGSVRAPARRRVRGVGLPARRSRLPQIEEPEAERKPKLQAAAAPDPRRGDAAAAAEGAPGAAQVPDCEGRVARGAAVRSTDATRRSYGLALRRGVGRCHVRPSTTASAPRRWRRARPPSRSTAAVCVPTASTARREQNRGAASSDAPAPRRQRRRRVGRRPSSGRRPRATLLRAPRATSRRARPSRAGPAANTGAAPSSGASSIASCDCVDAAHEDDRDATSEHQPSTTRGHEREERDDRRAARRPPGRCRSRARREAPRAPARQTTLRADPVARRVPAGVAPECPHLLERRSRARRRRPSGRCRSRGAASRARSTSRSRSQRRYASRSTSVGPGSTSGRDRPRRRRRRSRARGGRSSAATNAGRRAASMPRTSAFGGRMRAGMRLTSRHVYVGSTPVSSIVSISR